MKKAVAYLRVSTNEQVERYGFDRQLSEITGYAKRNEIEIVQVFREEGVSGTKDLEDRFEFVKMLDFIEQNPDVQCIIISELSRLARDLMIQEKILGDLKSRGIELISVAEPDLNDDHPLRKMLRQFMGIINEYERAVITARMKAGRIEKARKGEHAIGRIPTGYKSVIKNGKRVLEKDTEEVEIVRLIFELREKHQKSYREIADYLNSKGYKPKYSQKFGHTTVRKIYLNPKYRGVIKFTEGENTIVAENENYRVV